MSLEGQHKNNANKNWINKIIGETENILSYQCHCFLAPPPLAPPPSPFNSPTIWFKRAHFAASQNVLFSIKKKKRKKKVVNAEKIHRMEPLSILRKMAQ